MKRITKILGIGLAVALLMAVLFAFAMPVASVDVDVGAASASAITADQAVFLTSIGVVTQPAPADLAVMDSETILIAETLTAPVPATIASTGTPIWIALSAFPFTLAVVKGGRRPTNPSCNFTMTGLPGLNDIGTEVGRGPRDCIIPVAA